MTPKNRSKVDRYIVLSVATCLLALLCVGCASMCSRGKNATNSKDDGPQMGQVFVADDQASSTNDAGTASVRMKKGVPELIVDAFPRKK